MGSVRGFAARGKFLSPGRGLAATSSGLADPKTYSSYIYVVMERSIGCMEIGHLSGLPGLAP